MNRFYYTDRRGELQEVGCELFKIHESGALILGDEDGIEVIVAPGDWHDLTTERET